MSAPATSAVAAFLAADRVALVLVPPAGMTGGLFARYGGTNGPRRVMTRRIVLSARSRSLCTRQACLGGPRVSRYAGRRHLGRRLAVVADSRQNGANWFNSRASAKDVHHGCETRRFRRSARSATHSCLMRLVKQGMVRIDGNGVLGCLLSGENVQRGLTRVSSFITIAPYAAPNLRSFACSPSSRHGTQHGELRCGAAVVSRARGSGSCASRFPWSHMTALTRFRAGACCSAASRRLRSRRLQSTPRQCSAYSRSASHHIDRHLPQLSIQ
jgi:hypothetical protein